LQISPPTPLDIQQLLQQRSDNQPVNIATDVQGSIDRMLEHTKLLKPVPEQTSYTGPVKKRGLKDFKVLSKVKNAFNDRMQARTKKRHDPMRDDRLLDSSATSAQNANEEPVESSYSDVEIRLNEGKFP
jgi:hypothetical protein